MVDRHSFHLENAVARRVDDRRVVRPRVLRQRPSVPPQIIVPPTSATCGASGAARRAARARVEIDRRARRETAPAAARRRERAHVLSSDVAQSEARRCNASRRSSSCARHWTSRRYRCGSSAGHLDRDGPGQRRLDGRLPGRPPEEAALPQFGIKGQVGMDDFAAMGEMVSRRFARLAAGRTADQYDGVVRGSPEPRRRRRRQGPARGGARGDAGVRPAARRGDLACEARGGGVRARVRARPVVLSRHDPGLQLLQRVRDEANCFAVGFHRQRRESRWFLFLLRRARRGRGTRAAARAASAISARSRRWSRRHRRPRGRTRRAREGRAGSAWTPSCTKRAAADAPVLLVLRLGLSAC